MVRLLIAPGADVNARIPMAPLSHARSWGGQKRRGTKLISFLRMPELWGKSAGAYAQRLHMHSSPATRYKQIGHALDLADIRRTSSSESAGFYARGRV
jgi:hypothetical protein